MKKILVIEDDHVLARGLKETFNLENIETDLSFNGSEGLNKAINGKYDIIILDLILPDMSGFDICKDLRKKKIFTPIIMLTSKKDEVDKVVGLELGADDYVTKPFSIKELNARINAVLRRSVPLPADTKKLTIGDTVIDFVKMEARKKDVELKMSATEFKIMEYFCRREGEVISRDKFLDDVWGYDSYPTTRTVDNYILSLRKKIEDDPAHPVHLLTVYTIGYKFIR